PNGGIQASAGANGRTPCAACQGIREAAHHRQRGDQRPPAADHSRRPPCRGESRGCKLESTLPLETRGAASRCRLGHCRCPRSLTQSNAMIEPRLRENCEALPMFAGSSTIFTTRRFTRLLVWDSWRLHPFCWTREQM